MSVHALLGLEAGEDPEHWTLRVHDGLVSGSGALQGGAALGAAVEAMAALTGRPPVWATAQYTSHAALGDTLRLEVGIGLAGHRVTQAHARLLRGEHEVLRAAGAFGARDFAGTHTWATMPEAPAPEECVPRPEPIWPGWEARHALGRTREQLDGNPGPGRSASWFRPPATSAPLDAGVLAIVGDCSVLGLPDAMGVPCLGNSLDNTLRLAERAVTEWVLLDERVEHLSRGFASVSASLWSREGALLATFSQTLVVRPLDAEGRLIRTTKHFARD